MKPWMSDKDIRHIEKLLISCNKSNLKILEWGSGGSTSHFTKFLSSNGINYEWTSVEYNRKWFDKVTSMHIENLSIVLYDVGNDNLKQRYTNMDAYVDYPMALGKKFDVILVDGRKRRRCLINASKSLERDGITILHDAQREYYHCAFANYKDHKFLSKSLWVGKL